MCLAMISRIWQVTIMNHVSSSTHRLLTLMKTHIFILLHILYIFLLFSMVSDPLLQKYIAIIKKAKNGKKILKQNCSVVVILT